jgi:hypothetical protein
MTAYRAGSNAASDALYRIRGATPKPIFTATAPSGTVTWGDGGAGGSFSPATGNTSTYTPANQTAAVVISAVDGANTSTRPLTVFGTMPVQPQFGFQTELDIETKVKMALDRTRYFRESGSLEMAWVMEWTRRQLDEVTELRAFWAWHRKSKQFYLVDVESNIMNLVWYVTSYPAIPKGGNNWDMTASFRGVYQGVSAPS